MLNFKFSQKSVERLDTFRDKLAGRDVAAEDARRK
jgi:hypothetical protein